MDEKLPPPSNRKRKLGHTDSAANQRVLPAKKPMTGAGLVKRQGKHLPCLCCETSVNLYSFHQQHLPSQIIYPSMLQLPNSQLNPRLKRRVLPSKMLKLGPQIGGMWSCRLRRQLQVQLACQAELSVRNQRKLLLEWSHWNLILILDRVMTHRWVLSKHPNTRKCSKGKYPKVQC
jgi:hypothetical protein